MNRREDTEYHGSTSVLSPWSRCLGCPEDTGLQQGGWPAFLIVRLGDQRLNMEIVQYPLYDGVVILTPSVFDALTSPVRRFPGIRRSSLSGFLDKQRFGKTEEQRKGSPTQRLG
jgi:hypothetical protein